MWHCTPSYQSLNNITDFSNFFCHKLMENYKLYEAFHIAKECCCLYMHTPPFLCVSDSFCYFILNAQGCFQILNPLFFQSCKLLKISSWLEGTHLKSKFVRIGRNECKELYLNLIKGEGLFFFPVGWITAHFNSVFIERSSIHFHTFKWVRIGGGENIK